MAEVQKVTDYNDVKTMDKEEAEGIIKKIKEECDKHDRCNDCAFVNICFS